jgi:uncharacterized protein involved in exopolysaccharide biosynthesis
MRGSTAPSAVLSIDRSRTSAERNVMNQDHADEKGLGRDVAERTNDVRFADVGTAILRSWRIVIFLPLLAALVTGLHGVLTERAYIASATFMPQSGAGGSATPAAGIARQLGLGTTALERPGESPHFYRDLIGSRTILRETVRSQYTVRDQSGNLITINLMEYYGLPEHLPEVRAERAAMEKLHGNISVEIGRETGVLELTVTASQPDMAEQIAARLLELVHRFNIESRQGQAGAEGLFIAARLEEAKESLLEAETALQRFLQQNRMFRDAPELAFEHERLQRQVLMRQDVYSGLLQAHERARLDQVRDTPLITIIDQPAGSARPQGRGTLRRILLALIFGGMIAVAWASIREYQRRRQDFTDNKAEEFRAVARAALQDMRRPSRWLRSGA